MILRYVQAGIVFALAVGCVKLGAWHVQAKWDREKLQQIAANETESLRRVEASREVQREAQRAIDRQMADSALALAAAGRLRDRTAAVVAANTGTSTGSPSADDPIYLFSILLGKIDDRQGILAEYADKARDAGIACQRSYEALIK